MKLVVMPRRRGKSTYLLRWVTERQSEEVRVVVMPTEQMAMEMLRAAYEIVPEGQPLESWQFISHRELRGGNLWRGVHSAVRNSIVLGIDEVEMLLYDLLRPDHQIALATITCDLEVVTTEPRP